MDWNHIEGNSNQLEDKIGERWGDLTEGAGTTIVGHQKVRCLKQKQREASISETWDVVAFGLKVFAFSRLLMAEFAWLMIGRIF